MSENIFDDLTEQQSAGGAEAALARLTERLREQKRYHELFDARLMQARHRLGLPVVSSTSIEDLPEPLRNQVEESYLEACREVGAKLVEIGKFREAWMYLRPVGDKQSIAAALEKTEPEDDNLEELIEVALHEGVAPVRGFELVLKNYGTCNAITTFEGAIPQQGPAAQQAAAAMLVRHLYNELSANIRSHIEDRKGEVPKSATLGEMVQANEWIFENDNYHIDTSHLSATVRFARLIEDPETLQLALELTEYGRRLAKQFQYAGEEPFSDFYVAHGLLFAASLGKQVDEALAFFRERAETVDPEQEGTAAIETYLILLKRLGRSEAALEAHAQLAHGKMRLSPYAPRMLELARDAGNLPRYLEICRERGDVLAFAAGLAAANAK